MNVSHISHHIQERFFGVIEVFLVHVGEPQEFNDWKILRIIFFLIGFGSSFVEDGEGFQKNSFCLGKGPCCQIKITQVSQSQNVGWVGSTQFILRQFS